VPNPCPVVPSRPKAIVVGVTDGREANKTPPPVLPPAEVTVTLRQGTAVFGEYSTHLPRADDPQKAKFWARFEPMARTLPQHIAKTRPGSPLRRRNRSQ
jgi:hypothetical protein